MKLDLYDFDGTIYNGDSSVDFFKFCRKKDKRINKMIFRIIINFFKYKCKYITITEFKEYIFSYLKYFENIEELVNEFWQSHKKNIKDFYLQKNHSKDIIISASPYFLLKPICDELKVKDLIASDVNPKTGHFNKPNNRGEVKLKEFNKKYPSSIINEMYSDSINDKPLLDIAENSYLVKKNKIYDYKSYKPNIFKKIWNWCWSIYHKNEELWNYLIVGGCTTLVSIGSYALFSKCFGMHYVISNILSWVLAVVFAYFTNKWFVFHSKTDNIIKEFITFTGSRVLTLLIDTGLMILFVDIIKINDVIAKLLIQIIITISNYIISKLLVFKDNNIK